MKERYRGLRYVFLLTLPLCRIRILMDILCARTHRPGFIIFKINKHCADGQTWLGLLIRAYAYGETFFDARTLFHQVHGQFGNYQSTYLIQVPLCYLYQRDRASLTSPTVLAMREIQANILLSCAMLCGGSGNRLAEMRALASCTTACTVFSASSISRSY